MDLCTFPTIVCHKYHSPHTNNENENTQNSRIRLNEFDIPYHIIWQFVPASITYWLIAKSKVVMFKNWTDFVSKSIRFANI